MDKLIRKTYQASTKAVDDSRTLLVKISTSSPDRSKDVVIPKGAHLDNYLRNPVVALAHKYDGLSIAKTDDIHVTDDGIVAKVTFPEKGVYSVADTVYELYKGGFMNAWSIGFIPLEVEDREEGGREFKEWELLEYSAVLVPDNPEALTLLRSKGIDTKELEDILKEKGVIPFKETPTADPDTPWDGPAEIREAEVDDLKIMCAWFDSDNPDIKQSYKLPHHKASGEHPTVLRGVFAAMGALLGARGGVDIPDSDRRGVYNHLARHYRQYDAEPPEFRAYTETELEKMFGDEANKGEEKDGAVIRGKNRKLLINAIELLEQTSVSLKTLLEAKEEADDDESQKMVLGLIDALKVADKVVGIALRDYKAQIGELGIVPDDSLQSHKGSKVEKGGKE